MERASGRPTLDELRSIIFETLDEAEAYFNDHGFTVVPGVRPWELCLPDDMQALTCRNHGRIDLSGAGISLIFSGSVEAYSKVVGGNPTDLRARPGCPEKIFHDDPDQFYGGIPGGHWLH